MLLVLLMLVAASLGWAAYHYFLYERAYRPSWSTAPLPPLTIHDGPYRSATVEQHLSSAPLLMKVTAFVCLFVGQAFALIMLLPSLFLVRATFFTSGEQVMNVVDIALLVYRLGPPLLARERRAVFGLEYAIRLLRTVAGAFALLAAFGLMREAYELFIITGAIAAFFGLTSVLLAQAGKSHGALFADATT
jgi:hypothetical protein